MIQKGLGQFPNDAFFVPFRAIIGAHVHWLVGKSVGRLVGRLVGQLVGRYVGSSRTALSSQSQRDILIQQFIYMTNIIMLLFFAVTKKMKLQHITCNGTFFVFCFCFCFLFWSHKNSFFFSFPLLQYLLLGRGKTWK